jgi:hypothetical protein
MLRGLLGNSIPWADAQIVGNQRNQPKYLSEGRPSDGIIENRVEQLYRGAALEVSLSRLGEGKALCGANHRESQTSHPRTSALCRLAVCTKLLTARAPLSDKEAADSLPPRSCPVSKTRPEDTRVKAG